MKDLKIIQTWNKKYHKNAAVIFVSYSELKNLLLTYSNDGSEIQNDIEKIGQIAREIHEFSSKYRRKTKKTRRSSAQGTDLLKIPKFEPKVKSSSDCDDEDSEYSMVISHQHDSHELNESFEMNEQKLPVKSPLKEIKQVDDLKESMNSHNEEPMHQISLMNPIQIHVINPSPSLIRPPHLIKPPPLIRPPIISTPAAMISQMEEGQNLQQFLRKKGLVENQNSSPLIGRNPIGRMVSLGDSIRSVDEENKNVVNFLGESIQKMKLVDVNFDVQIDQENRLFVSN